MSGYLRRVRTRRTGAPVLLGQGQSYKRGAYTAYAGLWYLFIDPALGLGHPAVEGVDYVAQAQLQPTSFPRNTRFVWRVPGTPPAGAGVYGYLQLEFGNYDWTEPPVPITPRRVNTITAFASDFGFTYDGDNTSSILHEFWLTTTAHQVGELVDKVLEVGLFARTQAHTVAYMNGATPIGTYNDGARTWKVVVDATATPPFIMFAPTDGADYSGTFDWMPALAYLKAQGRITGLEYFNGCAIGPEPRTGTGSVMFHHFTVTYA